MDMARNRWKPHLFVFMCMFFTIVLWRQSKETAITFYGRISQKWDDNSAVFQAHNLPRKVREKIKEMIASKDVIEERPDMVHTAEKLTEDLDHGYTLLRPYMKENYDKIVDNSVRRILIVSTNNRCGSTFLGQLIQSFPGSFYMYEPLVTDRYVEQHGEGYKNTKNNSSRQKMGTKRMSATVPYHWINDWNDEQLGVIEDTCANIMKELGYPQKMKLIWQLTMDQVELDFKDSCLTFCCFQIVLYICVVA